MRHSLETIRDARELWELGLSDKQVAEKMNLKRWMSVYDWRREAKRTGHPWERKDAFQAEEIALFRTLRIQAKTYLESADFNSIPEALKVFKELSAAIKVAEKVEKDDGEEEKPSVMKALGIDNED